MSGKPIVDWFGHIESVSGYGRHARGLTFNMDLDKVDLAIIDPEVQQNRDLTEGEERALSKRQKGRRNSKGDINAIEVYNFTPWSAVHFAYENGTYSYWNDNIYKVLCTVYESPEIPNFWESICEQFDEIWTPSRHAKDAFKSSGIRDDMPYRVFREGVNQDLYTPDHPPLVDNDQFTFLSVFDFTFRKGWDKLIRAYANLFTKDDPVKLLLKTHYGSNDEECRNIVRKQINAVKYNCPNDPEIEFYWDWIPERDMPRLYNSADAFVLPTRGEGFGLPIFESAACGLPVITTRHFAPVEFLGNEVYWVEKSGMIDYPFKEAIKHEPNCVGLPFAEPSVSSLKHQMKTVYNSRCPMSPDVSHMGWEEPANNVADRLKEIWEDLDNGRNS